MSMDRNQWWALTLVTALGAGTILEARMGQAIPPHVEVNLPPPPPMFPETLAVTGSGPLLVNVHDYITATAHVNSDMVFIIRL